METEKIMFNFDMIDSPWAKEAIRSLRNKLVMDSASEKVLCISSLYPRDGVTTITRMLAFYLSDIHKNVIVVSADLKHRNSDIPSVEFTLKNYLNGDCALGSVVQNVNDHFKMIIGSNSDEDHSDLLYQENFANLIAHLKTEFDMVLIDAPSFSTAAETFILSKLADSLILVIKENALKINEFSDFCKKLQKQNILIKGVVLNQVKETGNLEISSI